MLGVDGDFQHHLEIVAADQRRLDIHVDVDVRLFIQLHQGLGRAGVLEREILGVLGLDQQLDIHVHVCAIVAHAGRCPVLIRGHCRCLRHA